MLDQKHFTVYPPVPKNLKMLRDELAELMADYRECLNDGDYVPNTLDSAIESCLHGIARLEAEFEVSNE